MYTDGILEEMFAGHNFLNIYINDNKNYAVGFEIRQCQKKRL